METFRRAAGLMPHRTDVYHLLGLTCTALQRYDEASAAFKKVIDRDPNDATAQHLLDAVKGRTTRQAPADYVVKLFDRYCRNFDHHMNNGLDYRLPGLMKKAVQRIVRRQGSFRHMLDLGCGTGLVGNLLGKYADRSTGVDVSGGMLAVARKKKIYDTTVRDEATHYLAGADQTFDLVVAADVFIYFGDLEKVFRLIRQRMVATGRFLFSIESTSHGTYYLCKSGRYAHSNEYVRQLAANCGLAVMIDKSIVIRKHGHRWANGHLFMVKKVG
jgi:predicted TPR repeat methyltransferase